MRSTLTVHELEAFLAVAELRNFRLAAERVHVSQPALSRSVQSAEHKLDARLFDRNTRRVELTREGEELLPIARRIVGEFHDSLSDLSEFVAGRRGRIAIACLPSAAAALLPRAMSVFQATHPRVTIALEPVSAEFVRTRVLDGSADFAISVAPPRQDGLAFEPLISDEFVCVCSRGDPLASRRRVSWSVLAERPLVASGPASSIRQIADRVMAQCGLAVQARYECANISVVGAMVAAGLGIAAIPRLALRLIDMSALAAIPLASPGVSREMGILTRSGRSLPAAAGSFLEVLRRKV